MIRDGRPLNKRRPVYSMSEVKDDGGPAFPQERISHMEAMAAGSDRPAIAVPHYVREGGMSLRDYFAVHADLHNVEFRKISALVAFLGDIEAPVTDADILSAGARAAAKLRYLYADAMLTERSK